MLSLQRTDKLLLVQVCGQTSKCLERDPPSRSSTLNLRLLVIQAGKCLLQASYAVVLHHHLPIERLHLLHQFLSRASCCLKDLFKLVRSAVDVCGDLIRDRLPDQWQIIPIVTFSLAGRATASIVSISCCCLRSFSVPGPLIRHDVAKS